MSAGQVYHLKIQMKGSKPPIWRRIQVPGRVSLAELHPIILAAMGWYGGHLYAFWVGGTQYGSPDPELGMADAQRLTLTAAARTGARLSYDYDFGDDWEHHISVEKILPPEPGVVYPRCVTGRRACPPEDCGGMYGFYELLQAAADPQHPEHERAQEILPPDYDPAISISTGPTAGWPTQANTWCYSTRPDATDDQPAQTRQA